MTLCSGGSVALRAYSASASLCALDHVIFRCDLDSERNRLQTSFGAWTKYRA